MACLGPTNSRCCSKASGEIADDAMNTPSRPPIPPGNGPEASARGDLAPSCAVPLPAGHVLQKYVIEGVISTGALGIVYLARSRAGGKEVAIEEYMPSALASRLEGGRVSVRSECDRDRFELGRCSFVHDAQWLAAFDQPALVKVHRVWEQNGTAYKAVPRYQGTTLACWLQEQGSPSETWLLALLQPLVDALEVMHQDCCYHLDVTPDNILLLQPPATPTTGAPAVRPLLLDGGGACRTIIGAGQAGAAQSAYAAIELADTSASLEQGAWTDVYALCGVLYAAVTGRPPMPSASRMDHDGMVPAVEAGAGRYSPQLLAAIDAGLSVRPEQRPQDMAALRALIGAFSSPSGQRPNERSASMPLVDMPLPPSSPSNIERPSASLTVTTTSRVLNKPLLAVGALAVLLAMAGGCWMLGPRALGVRTGSVRPASPERFTAVGALQDIVRHADPHLEVTAVADKSPLHTGMDRLRVTARESGYLYVFSSGADDTRLRLLFPKALDQNNRIEANVEVVLPSPPSAITLDGAPGANHLVAVVSRHPRDLSAVGLRAADRDEAELDPAQAERLWGARAEGASPFVGGVMCAAKAVCDMGYGASRVEAEQVAGGGSQHGTGTGR